MGGKSSAPPPPNYAPLMMAQMQQAGQAQQMEQQQYNWARQQYAADQAANQPIRDAELAAMQAQMGYAAADRQRYNDVLLPLRDRLRQQAQDYASEGRQDAEAGTAATDVSQQFAGARQAAQDRLESFGIDPSQVRAGALDIGTRVQEAAARAGAANVARARTVAMGRGMLSEVANMEAGLPSQALAGYGSALQAGQAGANTTLATTASGANSMGTGAQWGALANQGYAGTGNLMNEMYGNQIKGYTAQNQASSGWGQALGLAGGIGMMALGAPPTSMLGKGAAYIGSKFAAGGEVPEAIPTGAPVGETHSGISVKPEYSPSRGAITDDVPAQLNAGEFVVPKDIVSWKGEEFFQKLIENSRKKKTEAPAKPSVGPAAPLTSPTAINTTGAPAYAEGGPVYLGQDPVQDPATLQLLQSLGDRRIVGSNVIANLAKGGDGWEALSGAESTPVYLGQDPVQDPRVLELLSSIRNRQAARPVALNVAVGGDGWPALPVR